MPIKVWPQHLGKIGTRCSRMGAGRASGRSSSSSQEVGLGWGGAGSGVARGTLGRTPGCPLPPVLQGRHHCLQTGAAKLLTDSRIRLVRRDNQVQGGTWEVPRKATSWPEICPCCPTDTALLPAKHACSPSGRKRAALSSECLTGNWCTQKFVFRTAIKSCPGWGALWQRKPDH